MAGSSRTVVARAAGATTPHSTEVPPSGSPDATHRNEVVLVGRLSGTPEQRELPSGDRVVTWRLVVARGEGRRPPEGVRPTTVDTFDCVAWTGALRRRVGTLLPDDVVEVRGALRRRFWRSGAGTASRCEVEAAAVRRVSRRAAPR